jgi:hypothetical protein
MDWTAINRTNRIKSAKKAREDKKKAEKVAYIENEGGAFTLEEIKQGSTTIRTENLKVAGCQSCEVWTMRGKDWLVIFWNEDCWLVIPFNPYKYVIEGQLSDSLPVTVGAKKWLTARAEQLAIEEEARWAEEEK